MNMSTCGELTVGLAAQNGTVELTVLCGMSIGEDVVGFSRGET
jgi:hypothetical protein